MPNSVFYSFQTQPADLKCTEAKARRRGVLTQWVTVFPNLGGKEFWKDHKTGPPPFPGHLAYANSDILDASGNDFPETYHKRRTNNLL